MLVICPKCLKKSRIAASTQVADTVRYLYCQCLNLNCGCTFKGELVFIEYIQEPKNEAIPPDPKLQPELLKNPNQNDLFAET